MTHPFQVGDVVRSIFHGNLKNEYVVTDCAVVKTIPYVWLDGFPKWHNAFNLKLVRRDKKQTSLDTGNSMKIQCVTTLALGAVIDRSQLPTNAAELGKLMADVYTNNRRVVIVDNAQAFFRSQTLISKLEAGDKDWDLIAEKLGVKVSDFEVESLNSAVAIRQRIKDTVAAMKGPYPFVDVPDGYTLPKRFTTGLGSIQDKQSGYTISKVIAEKAWKMASLVWANPTANNPRTMTAKIDYQTRQFEVTPRHLRIGCQTISRLDVEQLAAFYNWDFPETQV